MRPVRVLRAGSAASSPLLSSTTQSTDHPSALEQPLDGDPPRGEIFYFDYGCLAFWGLSERQVGGWWALLGGTCL